MIATSAKVELKGIDKTTVEKVGGEGYFSREKTTTKANEEAFFKQGEKPEVSISEPMKLAYHTWGRLLINLLGIFTEEEGSERSCKRPESCGQGTAS